MKIRFIEGPFTGRTIEMPKAGMLIGRDKTCDLALNGEKVSRNHARIRIDKLGMTVEDLQSMNGVYVNGTKITGPRTVVCDDRVRVGDHLMLLTTDDAVLSETQVAKKEEAVRAPDRERAAKSQNYWVAVIVGVIVIAVGAVGYGLFGGSGTQTVDPPPEVPVVDVPDSPEIWEPPATDPAATGTTRPPRIPRATTTQPEVPTAPEVETVDYIWVQSDPPGAGVLVDGQPLGQTPVLAANLADGVHRIQLQLDGYQTLEREIYIPYIGEFPTYQLVLKEGMGLITSEPSGASVFLGSQLLGRTPYWLRGQPPGTYELIVTHTGLEKERVELPIEAYRGNQVHVELASVTGRLSIRTVPADAEVLVDGVVKGTSVAGPEPDGPSAPLVVDRLYPGTRQVSVIFRGRPSMAFAARLPVGGEEAVIAYVWLPNFRCTRPDGKPLVATALGRDEAGSYLLGLESGKIISLPEADAKNVQTRTIAEAFAADGAW